MNNNAYTPNLSQIAVAIFSATLTRDSCSIFYESIFDYLQTDQREYTRLYIQYTTIV